MLFMIRRVLVYFYFVSSKTRKVLEFFVPSSQKIEGVINAQGTNGSSQCGR